MARKKTSKKNRSKARGRVAKISDLKQAAPSGRARVSSPRTAPSGFASVPVSVASLPPGQGPPMSSTPGSGKQAGRSNRRSATSVKRIQAGANAISSAMGGKKR